jgi:hypothetical protein
MFFHLNLLKATIGLMIVENGELFFGKITSNDDAIMLNLNNDCN